ncbi:MAG: BON domain-containing protein [Actinomycetota bacterium]
MAVRNFRADDEDLALIRDALDRARGVDATRIDVASRGGAIALMGWVAREEEATMAVTIAQGATETPVTVVDELQVDPNLREGIVDLVDADRTIPVEGEVLIGSTDMLAGPDAMPEEDVARAIEESEPWSPPDEPQPFPEPRLRASTVIEDAPIEAASPHDDSPAAADLTQADLARGRLPSLHPDAARPPGEPAEESAGVDELGRAPDDDALQPMVDQMPGTAPGPGAVDEYETEGGSIGSVAATETGARGVDTASSDPARQAGGTSNVAGTHRGPPAREDEALREDYPTED